MSEQSLHPEPPAPEPSSESPQTSSSIAGDPPGHTPSLEEAKRFLDALAPTGIVTFQTLPERKKKGRASGANTIAHSPKLPYLAKLNRAGAGVFVMVNKGDGQGRRLENVQSVRAVFVDLDGAELQPVLDAPIPPSITVESSPGRYHAYWLVRGMPMRDFKAAQQKLAAMFNGDKAVCDLPRIMRVPGFLHQKAETPYRSRLLRCEPELVWEWQDLAKGLGLPMSTYLPSQIPEGDRNTTLFKIAGAAAMTGSPKGTCLSDLLAINDERCIPPLPLTEVAEIVERAYRNPPMGSMQVPLALLSDERFLSLGHGEKLLLLLAYQRIANKPKDSEIPVLWKDFKQHFPRVNTFKDWRASLVACGLLLQTKEARRRFEGGKPDYNLYKLAVTAGI